METRRSVTAAVGALVIGISACEQAGGAAAASRDLADEYGAENVDLLLRNENGETLVDVTVTDPSFAEVDRTDLERRACQVGETVARHLPLVSENDAITVALVAGDEGELVRTTRTSTFRFTPTDLECGEEPAP